MGNAAPIAVPQTESLLQAYESVRRFTLALCEPLSPEDCVIQSMPDVSPTCWHLAHTTWFFETFVLAEQPGYRAFDPAYNYLFNSYYNAVGRQFPRVARGLISRPGLAEVVDYRRHVDEHLLSLLAGDALDDRALGVVELGLEHERQHQELIVTDIKHVLAQNPLFPVYRAEHAQGNLALLPVRESAPRTLSFDAGVYWIGHEGPQFAYDNEGPRHRVFLEAFELAVRLATCGEYLEFMSDGGYERPELWLSLGWQTVCEQAWRAPLHWHATQGGWRQFTLAGLRELLPDEPVCHVSYFEADAFARWCGARLPTEAEWEVAAASFDREHASPVYVDTLFAAGRAPHPQPEAGGSPSLLGNVWQWTSSSYAPYPGYRPAAGALGEYNGKFMCQQYVLRGGSCATHSTHIRPTYRNFFPPDARWQFSGIRLSHS